MASQDIDCNNLSEKEWDQIPKTCPALAMFEPSECRSAWSQLWGVPGKGSADSDRGPITTICNRKSNAAAVKTKSNDDEDEVLSQAAVLLFIFIFFHQTVPLSQELSPVDFCDICGLANHEDKLLICENCVTGL